MVRTIVDNVPADIRVIIFRLFFSLFFSSDDFTSSRDTALHTAIEAVATIERNILPPPA